VPTDEPGDLADTVQRDTDKAVESVRRQRGELYEIEHPTDDANSGVEPSDTGRVS
jgi:hypothetical protein